jgi:hypothetical protein
MLREADTLAERAKAGAESKLGRRIAELRQKLDI